MLVIGIAIITSALFIGIAIMYCAYMWADVRRREVEYEHDDLEFWRKNELRKQMKEDK